MRKLCALLTSAWCLFVCLPGTVLADSAGRASSETEILLELLIAKGVISETEAMEVLDKVRAISRDTKPAPAVVESVQRPVPPVNLTVVESPQTPPVKIPDWVSRIKLGGDLRLRYQGDFYDEENAYVIDLEEPDDLIANSNEDRQRFRYRARLSLAAQVSNEVKSVLRLSTGNSEDPISTNDTFGDSFNKDSILVDQAYLEWKPLPTLTLTGGRIPSPWFSTDLVWDRDLNFEGAALSYRHDFAECFSAYATAGAFTVEEVELNTDDKWLYGAQVGMRAGSSDTVAGQVGVAYYYYDNIVGVPNDPLRDPDTTAYSAPGFMQKGNTLMDINATVGEITPALASEFQELDILATLDIGYWDPVRLTLVGEYVKNFGFDRDEVSERHGLPVDDTDAGYLVGVAVGHPAANARWKWNASLFYKYLEGDAVLDAFTDSDFHLGGTNAKGWVLSGELGLADNLWLGAKWQSADEVDGPPLAIDVLQVDLNAKF